MKQTSYAKRFMIGIALAALAISTLSWAQPTMPDYNELVSAVKNNARNVDFKALRMAYTKTKEYQPYGAEDTAKMAAHAALSEKNYSAALKQADIVLKKNYVDLDAHLISMIGYRETGHADKASFHGGVLKGLVGSIYSSGDGKSPEKAFVVISVEEEYFFLNANRLKRIKSHAMMVNGHHYDKMEVENKQTNEKSVIYFNIDIPYTWLGQNLKKKP